MLVYVQIFRFFAAAAVVAFHAWAVASQFIPVPDGTFSFGLQHAGHGVDLFFVISGFIIFYASRRVRLTPADFLRRRIERIVPLYFFVTFVVVTLAAAFPATFGAEGWGSAQHILKSLAFISFTDGTMPVVYVGWSLEYEMFFYLTVALLMGMAGRETWRAVVVLFSALAVIGRLPGVADALGNYAFFTEPLLLEFVLGVLIGGLFVHRRVGHVELAAAGCAFAALLITDPTNRAIVYGLPSAALVAAAAWISAWRTRPSPLEAGLERLGDASYAIYLAQVNTVSLTAGLAARMMPDIAPLALVAIVTTVVVLLGLLLNIAVERPLLKLCRSLGAPRLRGARA
jgi:exopolysaccharide production protein ExoZ